LQSTSGIEDLTTEDEKLPTQSYSDTAALSLLTQNNGVNAFQDRRLIVSRFKAVSHRISTDKTPFSPV
jgi:hypothetical protein